MKALVKIFSQLSVEFIISEGSLLHLYRNCSLGTSDIDFLIPLSWWDSNNSHLLRAALGKGSFDFIKKIY